MIYVALGFLLGAACYIYTLRRHYRRRLAQEYLDGFRDGVRYEATANHASAPKIAAVRVPLMGRN